ncbi:MAG: hypothetical protein WEB85_14330 [Dongiaceae bacterium]
MSARRAKIQGGGDGRLGTDPALGKRIAAVADLLGTRRHAAAVAGVSADQLGRYIAGRNQPGFAPIARVAAAAGVRLDWLWSGEGAMRQDAADPARRPGGVPVIGLAECGLRGWYQGDSLAVRAARPGDMQDPDAFAVMATGSLMKPAGIFPGFLCICSPATSCDAGDAVFLERRDGAASIKLYLGRDADWLLLRGYLPPDADGAQPPYDEKIRLTEVRRIATVLYVKRKL